MVLLARIYYPEGYNRLWFCSREFTSPQGYAERAGERVCLNRTYCLKEVDRMKTNSYLLMFMVSLAFCMAGISNASQTSSDPAPKPDEQQLPKAMHSAM